MASIFSFVEPTRVSSPWLKPQDPGNADQQVAEKPREPKPRLLSDYDITKLDPEPQEGPVEYKMHLLLPGRDKRKFLSYSTSSQRTQPATSASNISRQERLEHLSTQLLWRLKQSSQFHATSSRQDTKPPMLPEDIVDSGQVPKPEKLPIGLEDSQGALYEIGVHDGGTLVGLPKDEMDQSLLVLRNMAASLGCDVQVLRMIDVGYCEYEEDGKVHSASLFVSEALVTPDLALSKDGSTLSQSTAAQIRVTLAGPTTAGKSTLLGTLSTGTLDNGEGSSRLSLLRHRHEVASGLTSSVAQELIGYKNGSIFSFARDNVESWIDIHDGAEGGRLVFVSDSAGATRFRRTILRGLVGWAPHWIILCIAANDSDFSGGLNGAGQTQQRSPDLASEQLDICLKLGVPLVVTITKCDLASQQSFRAVYARAKATVEKAGRKPMVVPNASSSNFVEVPAKDDENLRRRMAGVQQEGVLSCVPFLFTSSVTGVGISTMHALLANLPVPAVPRWDDLTGQVLNPEQPRSLFHIDDKYNMAARTNPATTSVSGQPSHEGCVVSGHVRFGSLEVGTRVVVGPFPPLDDGDGDDFVEPATENRPSPKLGAEGLSALGGSSPELARLAATRNAVSATKVPGEWHAGRVATVRNLRLPVQRLAAGQVGTLGIILLDRADDVQHWARVRKGMVVAVPTPLMDKTGVGLQAASGVVARFLGGEAGPAALLTPGMVVHVYVASLRIAGKVTQVAPVPWDGGVGGGGGEGSTEEIDDIFNLNDEARAGGTNATKPEAARAVEISLELLSSRAWIEMGSQILLLYKSGLEALVGKVVEIGE